MERYLNCQNAENKIMSVQLKVCPKPHIHQGSGNMTEEEGERHTKSMVLWMRYAIHKLMYVNTWYPIGGIDGEVIKPSGCGILLRYLHHLKYLSPHCKECFESLSSHSCSTKSNLSY